MADTPSANPELKLETVTSTEETLIRCIGKLTYANCEVLRSTVHGLLPQTKHLVLDLKDMKYLDSYGLGVLVGIYLSAKRQDCQLRLINVDQQARNVLRITNLTYLVE